ncbi:MAG: DUF6531 domain-containing protein, partial [Candidatus Thiodiazotropha sp.]
MSTDVYTDGKCLVTQQGAATCLQPADLVLLKKKKDKGVAPHFNISTTLDNPAATVRDHNTEVAHIKSFLDEGKHAEVVFEGQNTGLLDGASAFLSGAKNFFIEGFNGVMDQVDAGINVIKIILPKEAVTAIDNAKAIGGGMEAKHFADAAEEEAQALLDAMISMDTLFSLLETLVMLALQGLPVIGQLIGGSAVVQRVANVLETSGVALDELADMVMTWTQDMSNAQLEQARQELASLMLKTGPALLLAVIGKKVAAKKSSDSSAELNSKGPKVDAGQGGKARQAQFACETCQPVIIATGEKTLNQTDFELPGLIPLIWSRKYRSGDQRESWFGQGWSSPWNVTLLLSTDQLIYHDAEGRQVDLPVIGIGTEHFDAYEQFTLTHPDPDTWRIAFKEGRIETFQRLREDHFNLPLTRVEDRNHNAIVFHYPAFPEDPFEAWHPIAISDSAQRTLALHWNTTGRLTAITWQPNPEALEQTLARYDYSPAGDLVAHYDASQAIRRYEWRNHILVAYTKADGARYIAEYDRETPTGRVIRSYAEADGRGLSFVYEDRARTNHITDDLGRTTHYEYDERKDIIATTGPDGQRVETPFDSNGNLRGKTDPLGRKTQYAYDQRGNFTTIVDASGARTQVKYNDLDLPTAITDALGHTWLRGYDPRGNLIV